MSNAPLPQIAALPSLPTPRLKAMWRELTGTEPPPFNRPFLIRRLAYRIQELAFGGLSAKAERRLDDLIDELENPKKAKAKLKDPTTPIPGTRLIREWQGVMHEVTTLADGYEYQGRRFKSLSAVARVITGTRWNGPLFFGLRRSGALGGAK